MRSLKELRFTASTDPGNYFDVSLDEFNFLMSQPETYMDFGPKVPVKREIRSSSYSNNLFSKSSNSHHDIEFDYNAPEYLKALAEWKARGNQPIPYYLGKELRVLQ